MWSSSCAARQAWYRATSAGSGVVAAGSFGAIDVRQERPDGGL
jgi:hypothetical protein